MPKPLSPNTTMLVGSAMFGGVIIAAGFAAVRMSQTIARSSRAILAENVSSLKAAEELEIALLDQKGMVGSYLLDGDERWLRLLEEKRHKYEEWFTRAREVALTGHERRLLDRIQRLYQEYDRQRYQVIHLAQDGNRTAALQLLLGRLRDLVDQLYATCEELLFFNEQMIAESQEKSERQVAWFQALLWSCIGITLLAGILGGWLVARRVTRQLAQSEKLASMGHMAGLVAHEVRNPLTAIKARVYSLQDELATSASSQEDIGVIRDEIERLERIVQNFLDLAHLPSPRMQPLRVSDALSRAFDLVKRQCSERGMTLMMRVPDGLPVVFGDVEQLEQLFLNLLLNAVQASPDHGAIELSAAWSQGRTGDTGHVEVSVSDAGPGIPRALREKIFDPFFTTKANGIGLGLSLAKKVAEQHGGSIAIRDRRGAGTTVVVRLPAHQPAEVPA